MLIRMIAQSADSGPGGWNGLKRKLLHLDIDGSGAVNSDGEISMAAWLCAVLPGWMFRLPQGGRATCYAPPLYSS